MMLDYLYELYSHTVDSSQSQTTVKKLERFAIRFLANIIVPIQNLFQKQCVGKSKSGGQEQIIVSITSYPARIKRLWIVLETIFHQTHKPDRIILWLSQEQFHKLYDDLPPSLVRLQSRGLEIRFVPGDIRSHKKYYYSFCNFSDSIVVLIDDDILYPSYMLQDITELMSSTRKRVVANYGFRFTWDVRSNYISMKRDVIRKGDSGSDLFFGSGGGTAFRPSEIIDYLDSTEIIMSLCPTADDIYLNALVRLAGIEIVFASNRPLITLFEKGRALLEENGSIGRVDSVNAKQFQALIAYMLKKYCVNPFKACLS